MEVSWSEFIALGVGGVVAVVVIFYAYCYGKEQLKNHKETMERVCDTHRDVHERSYEMFERALDRRDKDIQYLVSEIRAGNSSIIKPT